MFILIAIILLIGLGLYVITTINFEMGDGFSEIKKNIRDVDYKIVDKEEAKAIKGSLKEEDKKMLE